jgi:hypothetical protein
MQTALISIHTQSLNSSIINSLFVPQNALAVCSSIVALNFTPIPHYKNMFNYITQLQQHLNGQFANRFATINEEEYSDFYFAVYTLRGVMRMRMQHYSTARSYTAPLATFNVIAAQKALKLQSPLVPNPPFACPNHKYTVTCPNCGV